LHSDDFVEDADNSGLRWTWILPNDSHGVLMEVMDDYKPAEGLLAGD